MVHTSGQPEARYGSRKWYEQHGMDYDKHNRGFSPKYLNLKIKKSYYTVPQTRKSSKVAAIDHYILTKYHHRSGLDLYKHEDEFIKRFDKAKVGYLEHKDAAELEDKNYHTALAILIKHGRSAQP